MQLLEHIEYAFQHDGPVLAFESFDSAVQSYITLTATHLYYWHRTVSPNFPPLEADHEKDMLPAPGAVKYTSMIKCHDCVLVGDSIGKVYIFKMEGHVLRQTQEFVSVINSPIIDMDTAGDEVYVLHESGLVSKFIVQNGEVTQRGQPYLVHANATHIYVTQVSPTLPNLVFASQKFCVRVFWSVPDGTLDDAGYLSEISGKKDISAIDTTSIVVQDSIIVLGQSGGNVSVWQLDMRPSTTERRGFSLSFQYVLSSWQHGKKIVSVGLAPEELIVFSFDVWGCAIFWDIKKNVVLTRTVVHYGPVNECRIVGGLLLTAGWDGTAKVWRVWLD